MIVSVHPKLPSRNLEQTRHYYVDNLNFSLIALFPNYLIVSTGLIEIHFFLHKELNPQKNYGQIYFRCQDIDDYYKTLLTKHISIHPNGVLALKDWGQKEFSLLDPDHNLLIFGEAFK